MMTLNSSSNYLLDEDESFTRGYLDNETGTQCHYCNSAEEIELLRQELFENNKNLELAAKYGQNLLVENSNLKSHLESLSSDNLSLLEGKDEKFHELKRQLERTKADYESRLASMDLEVSHLRSELEEKWKQIEKLSVDKSELSSELTLQRASFMDTLKQRDESEKRLNDDLQDVKNQLSSVERNLLEEKKKEWSATNENDSLNLRLEEYGNKMRSVLHENASLKSRIEDLKVELEESINNIEELKHQNEELAELSQNQSAERSFNEHLYISNESLPREDGSENRSNSNKRRHSMFLSPSKESKLFQERSRSFISAQCEQDDDCSEGVFGADVVWSECEDCDDGVLGSMDNPYDISEHYLQQTSSEDQDEEFEAEESPHCKSWLEEYSEVEERTKSDRQRLSRHEEPHINSRCQSSTSTLSTFDQFDHEIAERIVKDVHEITGRLDSLLMSFISLTVADSTDLSGEKFQTDKMCRQDVKIRFSLAEKSLEALRSIHETFEGLDSQQSINSRNAFQIISERVQNLQKLLNFFTENVESERVSSQKANSSRDSCSQTITVTESPIRVRPEPGSSSSSCECSCSEISRLKLERDQAVKSLEESHKNAEQLRQDLENAIKSKAKLYNQLEEIQCADLAHQNMRPPSNCQNMKSPSGAKPIIVSTATKVQKFVSSPYAVSTQVQHSKSSQKPSKSEGRQVLSSSLQSSVAKQLFANRSSKPPDTSNSEKVVTKCYASSSDFIDVDYQSSANGSPSTSNTASPLARSKTLNLYDLTSFVSSTSTRSTPNGKYHLIRSPVVDSGDNSSQTASNEAATPSAKSITRRLSLWSR